MLLNPIKTGQQEEEEVSVRVVQVDLVLLDRVMMGAVPQTQVILPLEEEALGVLVEALGYNKMEAMGELVYPHLYQDLQ